jgi:nucleotide-binding universal stress UspA family protein
MAGRYDDIVEARLDPLDRTERTELMVEPLIAGLRALHPGVGVRIEAPHGQPARALVDASKDADLLLVGHPGPGQRFGHLGATARAVLRLAECPVQFLPDVDVALPTADLVLEDAGALRR